MNPLRLFADAVYRIWDWLTEIDYNWRTDNWDDDEDWLTDEEPVFRFYGGDGTIHGTGHLDVVTYRGDVREVWFRCQQLPFEQHKLTKEEASTHVSAYPLPRIDGFFLVDAEDQ